jgi:hypothetical protein
MSLAPRRGGDTRALPRINNSEMYGRTSAKPKRLPNAARFCHKRGMRRWRIGLIAGCVGAAALPYPGIAGAPADPLPEVGTVLRRIVERAQEDPKLDREFEAQYRFTHIRIREERNLKGAIKKREAEQMVHEPTSPADPTRSWQSEGAARVTGGADEAPSKGGRPYGQDDVMLTEPLLARFEFTIQGREPVAGRRALRMDFRPAVPERSANGLLDRFINHTAGTIWVDETDFTISRAVFWLTEKLTFGAGILGSVSTFDCQFARQRTDAGFWYTAEVEWHVECREFLVRKRIEFHETREDVRKVP